MTKLIPKLKINKRSLTVEIETLLLEKVKYHAKIDGLTIRQIVEFGLEKYLESRGIK